MDRLKLIALDMDGTVLDSRKQITPRVREALGALDARGILVAAATGRGLAEMGEIRTALPFMRFALLVSGAQICDLARSRTLEMVPMEPSHVEACLERCRAEDAMPHFLTVRDSVVRTDQVGRLAEFHHGDHQAAFERVCVRTEDMSAYARAHAGEILKVCMYHRDPGGRLRSLRALEGLGLGLKFSGRTSLEAVAPGIDKGEGLRRLAACLGLKAAECAAVGDADNDLEMLCAAGRSAAMGNAPEHVKRAADITVGDNDHDGAAEAAERLFGL